MRNGRYYPLLLEKRSTIGTVYQSAQRPFKMQKARSTGLLRNGEPALRQHPRVGQAQLLVQAEQDVHVLHRLARSALDQVVDHRQHHHQVAILRTMHRNTAHIGTTHAARFRMATGRHHIDERLIGITLFKQRLQVYRAIGDGRIQRGVNPADHRCQVRHEGQPHILAGSATQTLADFRQVPMTFYRIGFHAFRRFGVKRTYRRTTARTTDARLAVRDQARRIRQASLQQWQKAQLRRRRIATRHGNQARLLDLLAIDFRQ
ncbi:unnamed protein product, partial [Trypanosoma congolense IL3000]